MSKRTFDEICESINDLKDALIKCETYNKLIVSHKCNLIIAIYEMKGCSNYEEYRSIHFKLLKIIMDQHNELKEIGPALSKS